MHPPEFVRIYSDRGLQLIRSQNVRPTGIDLTANPVFFSEQTLKGKRIIRPKKGDVLIVRSGVNAGDIAVVEEGLENCIIGADTLLGRFSTEVAPKFVQVFFATNTGKYILSRYITGATNTHVSPHSFNKVNLPVVSVELQEKIVTLFENALTAKLLKEKQAKELLANIDNYLLNELGIVIRELPESGVVNKIFLAKRTELQENRFDPFYHQEYFNELFSGKAKYHFHKLGNFINQIYYGASVDNNYSETGIPLLRIKDLRRNEIILTDVVYLPENSRRILGNAFVKANDFLISRSGTIGVVSLVDKDVEGFAFGSFMIKFNLKNASPINLKFLSYYLNSKYIIQFLKRNRIGAIQGNITIPTIRHIPVCLPPIEIQNKIALEIGAAISKVKILEEDALIGFEQAKKEIENLILD